MTIELYCKRCEDEKSGILPRMDIDGPLYENDKRDQSQNYRCWCCNQVILVIVKIGDK